MVEKTVEDIIGEAYQLLHKDRADTISHRDIVNQLAWLLFLKCLEQPETNQQCIGIASPYNLVSLECHWDQWVPYVLNTNTPKGTLHFLINELQPHLEKVFDLKHDYMQINTNFGLFKGLLCLIHETEIIATEEEDRISTLYSALFQLLTKENKAMGVFATPPAVARFMVEVLNPGAKDIVYDPACGTGSLLTTAYKHACNENNVPEAQNFYGRDSAEQIVQLARMNMILHGFAPTTIQQQDVLHIPDQRRLPLYDDEVPEASVILTHPPLGSNSSSATSPAFGQPLDCYEAWFLRHSLLKLTRESYARCGMVVSKMLLDRKSNGNQSAKTKNTVELKKELLRSWNILMVVWLPAKTFGPLSNKPTYLLFFDNRRPTGKILHYSLAFRRKHKPYTEEHPVQEEDFHEALAVWKQWEAHLKAPESEPEPTQTDYQWITTYKPNSLNHQGSDDLYSVLTSSPHQNSEGEPITPGELIAQLQVNCIELQRLTQSIQELLSRHE